MYTYFAKNQKLLAAGAIAATLLAGCSTEESQTEKLTAWREIQEQGSLTVAIPARCLPLLSAMKILMN